MYEIESNRKEWHDYFVDIAEMVATRSTCSRKHVGAVIVKDRTILATGYNGSIAGTPHCNDDNHMMVNNHCVRTVHAEINAIAQAARKGVAIEGAVIYTTVSPCWECFKVLANAGIRRIFYKENYNLDERIDTTIKNDTHWSFKPLDIQLIYLGEKHG